MELDPLLRDLRDLMSGTRADVTENARREGLLRHLESADKVHPLELADYSLERAGACDSQMEFKTLTQPFQLIGQRILSELRSPE